MDTHYGLPMEEGGEEGGSGDPGDTNGRRAWRLGGGGRLERVQREREGPEHCLRKCAEERGA